MQSVIPSWSRLSTWFLLPQPGMEEDQLGELLPAVRVGSPGGRASPACHLGVSVRCCMSLFHCCVSTILSAAGSQQLEVFWWFQFGGGISWQRWVKATSMMAMAEEKALAGPTASGQFQEWRSQRCQQSIGMQTGGLSLPLPVTEPISLFSFPRKSCWRFFTFSSCLCLKETGKNQSFALLWVQRKNLDARLLTSLATTGIEPLQREELSGLPVWPDRHLSQELMDSWVKEESWTWTAESSSLLMKGTTCIFMPQGSPKQQWNPLLCNATLAGTS